MLLLDKLAIDNLTLSQIFISKNGGQIKKETGFNHRIHVEAASVSKPPTLVKCLYRTCKCKHCVALTSDLFVLTFQIRHAIFILGLSRLKKSSIPFFAIKLL